MRIIKIFTDSSIIDDDNDYYLTIYVSPDTYINYSLLSGSDLLKLIKINAILMKCINKIMY